MDSIGAIDVIQYKAPDFIPVATSEWKFLSREVTPIRSTFVSICTAFLVVLKSHRKLIDDSCFTTVPFDRLHKDAFAFSFAENMTRVVQTPLVVSRMTTKDIIPNDVMASHTFLMNVGLAYAEALCTTVATKNGPLAWLMGLGVRASDISLRTRCIDHAFFRVTVHASEFWEKGIVDMNGENATDTSIRTAKLRSRIYMYFSTLNTVFSTLMRQVHLRAQCGTSGDDAFIFAEPMAESVVAIVNDINRRNMRPLQNPDSILREYDPWFFLGRLSPDRRRDLLPMSTAPISDILDYVDPNSMPILTTTTTTTDPTPPKRRREI